ncbi:16S rRNA (cytosine(1402)-N(4))-methyltransferase RsmH [Allopusillimonas soli]|uniref:Ribosomal RNA small subunit methyltransferase H n=1 Tax=Allopusillimonas soli TaxID=659016 RepID=A0A853FFU3_9BURK|nr:16S rRNA (cytosine(1402)-N(4))-methyltransferase RsmH [Allopusillimonas soli]NYT38749.1 16S rRNA (cytosine(1402)-N(4))-methyltransferase RsmH [Allopusillimonas soli]TEA70267.1 16S rRNA (cytosine(1402)-N(4))-methyltransferase RsmH [Allopusillimonas soli]
MAFVHRSVLLEPAVNALVDPDFNAKGRRREQQGQGERVGGVFVDGTFGRGGHSRLLLTRLADDARLVVFDKDPQAIEAARELEGQDRRVTAVHSGFADMARRLAELGIDSVNGVLLDLGVSSPQIDDASRGFSFMREGPLDMRMDTDSGVTAEQWLAQASVEEMREVIAHYGEERFAFQIAKAIAGRRESRPLRTTLDLAELVAGAVRTREKGQHPATRTFQAIRIYLNKELEELAGALKTILKILAPGGRVAVISFHSLEDRLVKQSIAAAARPAAAQARLPIPEKDMPQPILISLGRILPDAAESADNVRARSAVLRVAQRTGVPLPADGGASFVPTTAPVRRKPHAGSRQGRRT